MGALACRDDEPAAPDATPPLDAGAPDARPALCGNGVAEVGEECDDGNDVDDDICADACTLNVDVTVNATIKWWFNRNDDLGFDGAPLSHHILTTDGILGRDTLGPSMPMPPFAHKAAPGRRGRRSTLVPEVPLLQLERARP